MVPVRLGWIMFSVVVALAGAISVPLLLKQRRFHAARVASLVILMYGLVVMLLWATTSPYFFVARFSLDRALKALLLAGSGGLLAQVAIWLNRLGQDQQGDGRVGPIYFDALTGVWTGAVTAALFALATGRAFSQLGDVPASLAGVVGGALGLRTFDVLKRAMPGLPVAKDPQAAYYEGGAKQDVCLYAGQAYSDGAAVAMPSRDGTVVKTCDGKSGRWVVEGS